MTQKTKEPQPSRFSRWLINSIFKDEGETKLGDFMEMYSAFTEEKGRLQARLKFWGYLIRSIPEYFKDSLYMGGTMLKNYLTVAFRNISKHKGYSFINISGLTLGIACSILILMWVHDEISFDSFHKNANELYRVTNDWGWPTPQPLAPTLKADFPEIIDSTRFITKKDRLVKYDDKSFYEDGLGLADPSFFDMFDFPFLKGDHKIAFQKINSIVITKSISEKYFGSLDPMGKILSIDNRLDLEVTGLLQDIPHNTNLKFDFLVPFMLIRYFDVGASPDDWGNNAYQTYIQVQKKTNLEELSAKILKIAQKYHKDWKFVLQSIKKVGLYQINGDRGSITNVYIFSALALLVLITACINFINLSTAKSVKRAKEVGIRKTVGAKRSEIIVQFFGESFFMSVVSSVFAILMVALILPVFRELSGKPLMFDLLDGKYIIGLTFIVLFTGILSGIYPAFMLSSFHPVREKFIQI